MTIETAELVALQMEDSSEPVGTEGIANEKPNVNGHINGVTPSPGEDKILGGNPNVEPVVSEGEEDVADDKHGDSAPVGVGVAPPKKKSKKKSKSKRGLVLPNSAQL